MVDIMSGKESMHSLSFTNYRFAKVLSGIYMLEMINISMLPTISLSIQKDIDISSTMLSLLLVCYGLAVLIILPASRLIVEILGDKNAFLFAAILMTVGSLGSAISTTDFLIISCRIIQGIGGALLVPQGRIILAKVTTKDEYLTLISSLAGPGILGLVIGPILGGALSYYFNWRSCFVVVAGSSIILTSLIFIVKGVDVEVANAKKANWKFRFIYSIYAMGIGAIFYSAYSIKSVGITSVNIFSGVFACVMVSIFFHCQYKGISALFNFTLFRFSNLKAIIISGSLLRIAISGTLVLTTLSVQTVGNFSAAVAGLTLLPAAISAYAAKKYVKKIILRLGTRNAVFTGCTTLGVCLICLGCALQEFNLPTVELVLFAYGFVSSIMFTIMNTHGYSDIPNEEKGDAGTLFNTFLQLSITLGISWALFLHGHLLSSGYSAPLRDTFAVLALMAILSGILFYKQLKSNLQESKLC
ncbi:MFS transporter [Pseudomonas syringae pv. syringae]|uniref:MFS transporter n=1 Tax=Pseudomonas TaxID=286 RepID=UPI001CE23296|nr:MULTISPECIES: MFS transporter [Pseudomonas]MCA5967988.1 MFS transporter [Pseudomonas sp. P129]MEE1991742.1 MFS transporter [Pseudomonas syringae pv. syringae]MEE1996797.1 MFS transporter [Pseudomonas syringae pv. syringae]